MRYFGKQRGTLARVDGDDEWMVQLIGLHTADAVIDVGANVGQYVREMTYDAGGFDMAKCHESLSSQWEQKKSEFGFAVKMLSTIYVE